MAQWQQRQGDWRAALTHGRQAEAALAAMGFAEDARQAQAHLRAVRDAAGAEVFDAIWQAETEGGLPDWLTGAAT